MQRVSILKKVVFSGFAAFFVLFLSSSLALAQTPTGGIEKITLSPSSRTIKADAGSRITGSMEVINSGDVPFTFEVYASPYGVTGENYDPDFTGKKPNADAHKWVTFGETEFALEPGQKRQVSYTMNIPANAAPGGHYGVLFAETKERPLGSTGVARQKRVGKILYVTVNGAYKSGGNLVGFILPFWQSKPPIVSSVRVSNTGNIDFPVSVRTVAKDIFGRTKYTYTSEPGVLPETTRLIEMEWKNAPTFGIFRISQSAKFLGTEHTNKGFVLVAPRWFPVLLLIIVLSGAVYAVAQRRKTNR